MHCFCLFNEREECFTIFDGSAPQHRGSFTASYARIPVCLIRRSESPKKKNLNQILRCFFSLFVGWVGLRGVWRSSVSILFLIHFPTRLLPYQTWYIANTVLLGLGAVSCLSCLTPGKNGCFFYARFEQGWNGWRSTSCGGDGGVCCRGAGPGSWGARPQV